MPIRHAFSRSLSMRPLFAAAVALALASTAESAAAQEVSGTLTEAGSGAPVRRALVTLLDAAGKEVRSVISDAAGRYRIAAPAAGAYTVRVERIGHRPAQSPTLQLAAGQVADQPFALETAPVTLEEVRVEAAGRRCTPRPGGQDGVALQRVWDEARKALSLTVRTAEDAPGGYDFETFDRTLAPDRQTRLGEEKTRHRGPVKRPFAAVSVEELAEHGFVRALSGEMVFYGLDAEVLLSDFFLERHCFHLREGAGAEAGMIGLAFEPVRGRTRPDVRGVLWLDRRTSELRHLVFDYAGVYPAAGAPADGRVDFARTPEGAWIVRSWLLRFPVAELHISRDLPTNYRLGPAKMHKEVGGQVVGEWREEGRSGR